MKTAEFFAAHAADSDIEAARRLLLRDGGQPPPSHSQYSSSQMKFSQTFTHIPRKPHAGEMLRMLKSVDRIRYCVAEIGTI